MGTACSRCHTPVENDQVKCSTCGSTGTYEISKLEVDKISVAEKESEQIAKEEAEEKAEQIAKEEESKQQEQDNSVEANTTLKQKLRERNIFLIVIALILIGVAFSYAVFFGLEY